MAIMLQCNVAKQGFAGQAPSDDETTLLPLKANHLSLNSYSKEYDHENRAPKNPDHVRSHCGYFIAGLSPCVCLQSPTRTPSG